MKKKLLVVVLIIALISCFGLAGCGSSNDEAGTEQGEVYTMRIAHLTNETDSMHQGALYLEKIIEERTNGQVQVDIYPAKTLASSDAELAEMNRNGSVEMAITTPTYIGALAGLSHTNIFDFPYVFQSFDELYAFCDSELGQQLADEVQDASGIRPIGIYSTGWHKIGTVKKPVEKLEDLKGQKIRCIVSDVAMGTLSCFGANPTPVNYGEVYTALQQGTVDGNMTATNLIVSEKYYEVMPNITCADVVPHVLYPTYNVAWLESLPEDLQATVLACFDDYLQYIRDFGRGVEEESIQALKDAGANVIALSDEEKAKFVEAAKENWSQKDLCGADFFDAVVALTEEFRANN